MLGAFCRRKVAEAYVILQVVEPVVFPRGYRDERGKSVIQDDDVPLEYPDLMAWRIVDKDDPAADVDAEARLRADTPLTLYAESATFSDYDDWGKGMKPTVRFRDKPPGLDRLRPSRIGWVAGGDVLVVTTELADTIAAVDDLVTRSGPARLVDCFGDGHTGFACLHVAAMRLKDVARVLKERPAAERGLLYAVLRRGALPKWLLHRDLVPRWRAVEPNLWVPAEVTVEQPFGASLYASLDEWQSEAMEAAMLF